MFDNSSSPSIFMRVFSLSAAALALIALSGCGGASVGAVSGNVTYKGKPVTGGSLTFRPHGDPKNPGKPAAAEIDSSGNYTLGTFTDSDGAIVGKHVISYSAPVLPIPTVDGKDPAPGSTPPKTGFEGLVPQDPEVEVKSGSNTINIELVPPKK